ncbi:MAG: L-2-hydroxyglutarate oxidase [Acidobacteriota bacterium]|jgi:L-2-hydroxyglutarate oxidase LhgO|nr:L-2-hydroxyglutarate oxidase [Bryobacteraceae bacterium CoA2 C42]MCA2963913.1 L-2-hydroxyglutarate oxidase [Acidobacteriaceae bacterium]
MPPTRIAIIGGGIVGLATALRLQQRLPHLRLTVFEKEAAVGRHQTGNNSGVLHAGLYYKPGSAKARLAVQGVRQMIAFCQEHSIRHEICGKLVVATEPGELPRLHDLHARGQQNGLSGLRLLSAGEIREIEPHAAGLLALRVPEEGIVDYPQVCQTMASLLTAAGAEVRTSCPITSIRPGWVLNGQYEADFLINCAGLHCDRVSALAGERRQARIIPFRGEYYMLKPASQHLVRHLIYPVPDPAFPFLGVHFTRLIHGGVEAGPNAVLAFAREGYRWTQVSLPDLWDALSFPGLWRFLARYPSMASYEIRRSLSHRLFCASLQRLVPALQPGDIERGGAGVRAQAMLPNGDLVQDFLIVDGEKALHLLNAPSPAATASLAIGDEIVDRIAARLTG